MTDVITGNTQLGATKEEVIAAIVQKELAFQAKARPFSVDYSMFARPGSKSVDIPKAGSLIVENRASATAGTIQALTFATDTIPLTTKYVSWLVDSADEVQSMVAVRAELARRAASAHGRAFDSNHLSVALAAAWDVAGVSGDITLAKHLDLRTALIEKDADPSKLVLMCAPDQYAKFLGDADVKKFLNYGQGNALPSGVIPSVYGVIVIEHNGLQAGEYFMYDTDAVGYAIQVGPSIASQPEIAYGTSAVREAMDIIYGHTALFKGQRGVQSTESALIVKPEDVVAPGPAPEPEPGPGPGPG
jgi:hypothetical protein